MIQGWQTRTLGEICTVDWGNTELTKSAYVEGGKFLAVSAAGCDGRIGHKEHEKYTPVLSAIGAQCGRMFLPKEDFTAIKNTITLTPRDGTCTGRFLYQLLTHVELPKRGAAQPFISKGDIQSFRVPVPPLPEQQRIVDLLDEAFEGLATAKANAEKNLQNARALFESYLQSVFTQRGEGWVEMQLGEVADFKNGLNFTRQSKGQTLRMVGVGDFHEHSVVPIDALQTVTIDGKLSDDYLIRHNDILTVRSNGSKDLVGRCMLVPHVAGMTSFSGFIIRIRFDIEAINPRFLLYFMKSSETRARLTSDGGGANISNINQAKLSKLPVLLPPLKRQEGIVKLIDTLSIESQHLAAIYKQKLAALEALKKSLLHQAFTGEL